MKVFKYVLLALFISAAACTFAAPVELQDEFSDSSFGVWRPVSGSWEMMNGKLVQTDTDETMAVIVAPIEQEGVMMYRFEFKYEGGAEDDYAGFGIHVGIDRPASRRSWGHGQSLLAWLTWDPEAYGYPGAFFQIYESRSNVDMRLHPNVYPGTNILTYGGQIPVNQEYLKREYLRYSVPVKLVVNTRTGEGRVYDPFNPDRYYFPFDLGGPIQPGSYFAFRTNSVSVSIDNVRVERVR
jgi:hypothetical protein